MKLSQIKRAATLISLLGPAAAVGVGCSSKSSTSPATDAGPTGDGSSADGASSDAAAPTITLKIPCTDSIASIYAAPGTLPGTNGAIIHCAVDSVVTAAQLYAAATATNGDDPPYVGPQFVSGASVYRVLYETTRGDSKSSQGYSSGLLYVPDHARAAKLPVIVASRGSRGQAPQCSPSEDTDAGAYVEPDFIHQVYPLVGYGYAVIAPDLAGYANFEGAGNFISAYGNAQDVGRSTLDGARALSIALAGEVTSSVVITGHSQGGGTALGALGLAGTYAPELDIAAVAVYAPLWYSLRSVAAIFAVPGLYPFPGQPNGSAAGPVAIWYHYTAGELLDGPGGGLAMFSDAGAAAVKSFVENDCWEADYPQLDDAGPNHDPSDVFDPAFMAAIGSASLPWNFSDNGLVPNGVPTSCHADGGGPIADSDYPACACGGSSNVPLCTKWLTRYLADRPHSPTTVPILIAQGGQDQTVLPSLAACVLDRMKQDKTNYSFCYNPGQSHSGIVSVTSDYVNQWIAHQVLDAGPPTTPCLSNESGFVDDAGAPIQCFSLLGQQ